MANEHDDGFLLRWARRKAQARQGAIVDEAPPPAAPAVAVAQARPKPPAGNAPDQQSALADAPATTDEPQHLPATPAPAQPPPPPTLEDARTLTPASDFRRFVASDVAPDVRNTALKTLWADPAYNVMDGLDIYIDDYSRPDPLPMSVLRQMAQAKFMNLFDDEPAAQQPSAEATPETAAPDTGPDAIPAPPTDTATETAAPDEDPDLRLQPHDAPGPPGAEPGAEPDPGRER